MVLVRAMGLAAETAAGIVGKKEKIEALVTDAAARFPDDLDRVNKILTEVKNVAYQSYTGQLQDFVAWAQQQGYRFEMWVRPPYGGTTLSEPVRELVTRGIINIETFLTSGLVANEG